MQHHIDQLLCERAPWLAAEGAVMRKLRAGIKQALSYDETIAIARQMEGRPALEVFDQLASRLARNVTLRGQHHIPRHGPAMIVANHPTGIADGIMLHHALRQFRNDAYFFANRDILRVLPRMEEMICPIEWQQHKRSRDTARKTLSYVNRAVTDQRLGVIFPSGRLAKRRGLRLVERPWLSSAASLARKFDIPIIPVHITARNSALFYVLDLIHPSLRDITLFHEMLNKSRQPFMITIGQPIAPTDLPDHADESIAILRQRTLQLGIEPNKLRDKSMRPKRHAASLAQRAKT